MKINPHMKHSEIKKAFDYHELGPLGMYQLIVLQGLFARCEEIEIDGFGIDGANFILHEKTGGETK
jgi:hypothetical protein